MKEAIVKASVSKAIVSSKKHFETLQTGGIHAVLFAAEHGSCGYMTKLHDGVKEHDGMSFRHFLANLSREIGVDVFRFLAKGDDKQKRGFYLQKATADRDVQGGRDAILKLGEKGLAKIAWTTPAQRDAVPVSFFKMEMAAFNRMKEAAAKSDNPNVASFMAAYQDAHDTLHKALSAEKTAKATAIASGEKTARAQAIASGEVAKVKVAA